MAQENPYRPPAAAVRDQPAPPRSPFIAILAGAAIDLGGSLLSGLLVGIVYAVMLAANGTGAEQIRSTLTEPDPSSAYFIVNTIIGYAFSLLGGYVCARLVRRREGSVTGILAAISGVAGLALGGATQFGWQAVIFFTVVQVACVLLGGELGRRRNLTDARKPDAATAA